MPFLHALRLIFLAFASFAYLANGAQAHVKVSSGETLELLVCSSGTTRTIEMHLPGDAPEEIEETHCGDCAPSAAVVFNPAMPDCTALGHALLTGYPAPKPVSPRSPLWPGAPPIGPPSALKI